MPEKRKDEIPEKFRSYEEAAEFWEIHESTDFQHALEDVDVEVDIQKRHYLVELDEEVSEILHRNAQKRGIPDSAFASHLLRKELVKLR